MDAQSALKLVPVLIIGAFLSGCEQSKTSSSVFPENVGQGNSYCGSNRIIANKFIVSWEDGRITLESANDADSFVRDFIEPRLSEIRFVEHDKYVQTPVLSTLNSVGQPKKSPDCPPTNSYGFTPSWHATIVNAPELWNQNIKGQGVVVAVVDTGLDYEHPKIKPSLAVNSIELFGRAGFDDDLNGYIDDIYGYDFLNGRGANFPEDHGTHVAGIIASSPTATLGTGAEPSGVAPESQIIGVKFLGTGPDSGQVSKAIQAIEYAVGRGAKIINASWGGEECSPTLKATVEKYQDRLLFVTASGNDGRDLDISPSYPAAYEIPNQIAVAASQPNDFLAGFSNTSYRSVHLGAPGYSVLSSIPFRPNQEPLHGVSGNKVGYDCYSGTSMATPVVSAAAALLWSAAPLATVQQVKEALIEGTDPRNYRVQSSGRLNVVKALEVLRRKMQ